MAKPPPEEDPRITDLRRYRKEREQAAKRKPPNPKAQMRETVLGDNPRAGLILVIVVVGLMAYFFLPTLLSLLP